MKSMGTFGCAVFAAMAFAHMTSEGLVYPGMKTPVLTVLLMLPRPSWKSDRLWTRDSDQNPCHGSLGRAGLLGNLALFEANGGLGAVGARTGVGGGAVLTLWPPPACEPPTLAVSVVTVGMGAGGV